MPAFSESLTHHRPKAAVWHADLRRARDLESRITHTSVVLPACPDPARGADPQASHFPVPSRAAWFALVENHGDAELLRADARETMLAIAYTIGWAADPVTMVSHPGLARCMEVSGKSLRTVQRWCRWLEARNLLLVLEEGTTPRFRPSILRRGDDGNLAREWRLTTPAVHTDVIPGLVLRSAPQRAREVHPRKARGSAADSPVSPSPGPMQDGSWPLGQKPQRRAERLAAAERLRAVHPVLRRISARMLRHLLRPWLCAGYSPADVLVCLEFRPSGEPHEHGDRVRHPACWLRARLSCWLAGDGTPRPSASQARDRRRSLARAKQDSRRREAGAAAARSSEVDVGKRVAELRAIVTDALSAVRSSR